MDDVTRAGIHLEKLSAKMKPDMDLFWSSYGSYEELMETLDEYKQALKNKDLSKLSELKFLFLATGDLQEIALSNGWGDEFLKLASEFDSLNL